LRRTGMKFLYLYSLQIYALIFCMLDLFVGVLLYVIYGSRLYFYFQISPITKTNLTFWLNVSCFLSEFWKVYCIFWARLIYRNCLCTNVTNFVSSNPGGSVTSRALCAWKCRPDLWESWLIDFIFNFVKNQNILYKALWFCFCLRRKITRILINFSALFFHELETLFLKYYISIKWWCYEIKNFFMFHFLLSWKKGFQKEYLLSFMKISILTSWFLYFSDLCIVIWMCFPHCAEIAYFVTY